MLFLVLKEVITIKKILFGITSLTLGGAERVLVDISNKLSEKYDITIFSIYDNGELKNDLNKNKLAKEKNIPLIRIPYWERDNINLSLIIGDKYLIF